MGLVIRENGTLLYNDIVIGRIEPAPGPATGVLQSDLADAKPAEKSTPVDPRLTLNSGWLRAAGLSLTVHGDPEAAAQGGRRRVVFDL